jgi:hypothetical protein
MNRTEGLRGRWFCECRLVGGVGVLGRGVPRVIPDLDGVGCGGKDCVCAVVVDAAARDVSASDYFPLMGQLT